MSRKKSIKYTPVIFAYIGILIVFLVLLDIYIVSSYRQTLLDKEEIQAQSEIALVGMFVTEPLLRSEFSLVEEFLILWSKKNKDVVAFQAKSPNQFLLAEYKRPLPTEHILKTKQRVEYEGRHLLDLEMVKDMTAVEKSLARLLLRLFVYSTFMVFILGLTLWFILKNLALRPLEREISRRQLTEDALKKAHDGLEVLVQERTAELSEVNSRLEIEAVSNKRQREEIERLYSLLDNIINSMPSMLVGVDSEGRVIQWNYAAEHATGITQDVAKGKKLTEVFPDLFSHLDIIRQAIHERKPKKKSKIATEHEGKTSYSDMAVYPLIANGINGAVIRVDNITEQVNSEVEREKLFTQLQQAQKMEAVGTLAGGIAHDFNNILSPIYCYTEMARAELPVESPISTQLNEVLKAANRARELVKQILTFSRQTPHERQPLEIHLVVNEALKLLRSTIPTTIEIKKHIESNLGTVLADPTQIHQVMMNLCTNAYHAMRGTRGVLAIRLTAIDIDRSDSKVVGLDLSPGPYLKLEVSDTGQGMDRFTRERIFEPYFTTKANGEGTGIGLAVVHGIVKNHGGHIEVYSEHGKGTTFSIYLPRIVTSAVQVTAEGPEPLPRGNEEQILIVDDDKVMVKTEQQILEGLGYQVTATNHGEEALQAFCGNPENFDLVITDMTMPQITGIELAQQLMAVREDIPIILCTGFSELINEEKAKALGIREYVMKPIVRQELAVIVRKVLDKR